MKNNNLLADMGKRLSSQRKQLGMTQEQLAEKMDVSIQMISNMELGKKAIRPENLAKVCEILGISSDYVLTGEIYSMEESEILSKAKKLSPQDLTLINKIIDRLIQT